MIICAIDTTVTSTLPLNAALELSDKAAMELEGKCLFVGCVYEAVSKAYSDWLKQKKDH